MITPQDLPPVCMRCGVHIDTSTRALSAECEATRSHAYPDTLRCVACCAASDNSCEDCEHDAQIHHAARQAAS